MVLRYCLGMIASVSTFIILSGAATPSSTVNFSIGQAFRCPSLGIVIPRRAARSSHCQSWLPSKEMIARLGTLSALEKRKSKSPRGPLDHFHVVVGQPEVMADLVHQHVGDD